MDLFFIWEGHYLEDEASVYVSFRCEPQIAPAGGSIHAIDDHEDKMQSVKEPYNYSTSNKYYAM